jgi:effector-binding domain-containing protein
VPNDKRVTLTEVPGRTLAAIRFSGRWRDENYKEHADELRAWIASQGLKVVGEPIVARYNAPIVPSFLRRNEILIPVESSGS